MAPLPMPNIMSRLLFEGVSESVVPGHTRTSPPPARRRTVVSDPAVTDAPPQMCRIHDGRSRFPTHRHHASSLRVIPAAVRVAARSCWHSRPQVASAEPAGACPRLPRMPIRCFESSTMRAIGGLL